MSNTFGKSLLLSLTLMIFGTFSFAQNHEPASETPAKVESTHKVDSKTAHHGAEKEGEHGTDLFPKKEADKSLTTVPGKAELKSPEYFAPIKASEVTLNWGNAEGADSFHLQVATDPFFKWLVVNEYLLKGNSYQVKSLETGKHYFWRVAGMKSNNDPSYLKGAFATSMFTTEVK